jgi:hypothetical protein
MNIMNEGPAEDERHIHSRIPKERPMGRDGSIRTRELHGWPAVQRSPVKSSLGRKSIEKAVSKVILERLLAISLQ